MPATEAPDRPRAALPQPAGRSPATVVARLVARRAVRSVIVWGLVFGLYVVGSISGFAATYKTQASRATLARTFGSNTGLQALIGPARSIDTIAGFAAWRCLGVLSLVGAVWALLAATRLIRGEEEAGRWELLLAGQTTRRRAGLQALAGLGAGWVVLLALTAVITTADGRSVKPAIGVGAALFFSLALTASAAMFLAVGAFTGQLAHTRRRAAGMAGGVLGAAYLVRVVADSGTSLRWLRWAGPLGWVEELRPLTGSRPLALVPIAAFTLVLGALAVHLAGARDIGAGILPEADSAPARTVLLRGPAGLALRLLRPVSLTWLVAIAGISFVEGLIAKGAAGAATASEAVQQALSRIGGRSGGTVAYLGLAFVVVTVTITLVACGQAAANREEEASGRLDDLLSRPVGRFRWLAARLVAEAAILAVCGVVAGVAAWVGAASQHTGVGLASLVEGGVNTVPPALLVLGFGALVHGAAPRLTAAATYGLVAWSFLIEFIGSVVNLSHWVLDTSVLYHLAPAPAASPHWGSAAGLMALGLAGALLGGTAFLRRDLVGA